MSGEGKCGKNCSLYSKTKENIIEKNRKSKQSSEEKDFWGKLGSNMSQKSSPLLYEAGEEVLEADLGTEFELAAKPVEVFLLVGKIGLEDVVCERIVR